MVSFEIPEEEQALRMAENYIRSLCNRNWTNIELEDRIAEASFFFLCAYRSLPINSGHFLAQYKEALAPYMKKLNASSPYRYRHSSLDARTPTRTGSWSLYDQLADSSDESALTVQEFLGSMDELHRSMILDLMEAGMSRKDVAAKYGLSIYCLNKQLKDLGEQYLQEYGAE